MKNEMMNMRKLKRSKSRLGNPGVLKYDASKISTTSVNSTKSGIAKEVKTKTQAVHKDEDTGGYCCNQKLWTKNGRENYSFFCPNPLAIATKEKRQKEKSLRRNYHEEICKKIQKRYPSNQSLSILKDLNSKTLQSDSFSLKSTVFSLQDENSSEAKLLSSSSVLSTKTDEKSLKSQIFSQVQIQGQDQNKYQSQNQHGQNQRQTQIQHNIIYNPVSQSEHTLYQDKRSIHQKGLKSRKPIRRKSELSINCNDTKLSERKPEPPPAEPLNRYCPCLLPCVTPCKGLCPCPKPCGSFSRSFNNYLPVHSSKDLRNPQQPFLPDCANPNPTLLGNHFWRSLYPPSPHSICSMDSEFQIKIKSYCQKQNYYHCVRTVQFSDAQVQTTGSKGSLISQRRQRAKVFDASENKIYTQLPTRVSSDKSLDPFVVKVIEFPVHAHKLVHMHLKPRDRSPNPSSIGRKASLSQASSRTNKEKNVPIVSDVLAKLRIRAPAGGLSSTKTTLTLGRSTLHRQGAAHITKLGPSSHPNDQSSLDGDHNADHGDNPNANKKVGNPKDNAPEKLTKRFKYKNILSKPQALNLGPKLKAAKPLIKVEHQTNHALIDIEFNKIRANNRPPIIWIYGYTQINVANAKREIVNQLAQERDYYIMNMDYEIRRLRGLNILINNNKQLTTQIMSKVNGILNKINSTEASLTPQELCEILKLAILIVHMDNNPPKGYIMDAFPLDITEAQTFERVVWPVVLGLYFVSGTWVEIKSEPPPCVQPKFYVRNKDYFEEDVEATVDLYGFKSIKIAYAEQLRGEVITDFMQFMQGILIKNILTMNGELQIRNDRSSVTTQNKHDPDSP